MLALSSEEAEFYAIGTDTQEVTLHQELPSGSSGQQNEQHQDPHRQFSRTINGNKTRRVEAPETHRAQVPVRPTTGAGWNHFHPSDCIRRQHTRHPDKINNRGCLTLASLRCRHQPTIGSKSIATMYHPVKVRFSNIPLQASSSELAKPSYHQHLQPSRIPPCSWHSTCGTIGL